MSEEENVTDEDVGVPSDLNVKRLLTKHLDELTDQQVSYVSNLAVRRGNAKVHSIVVEAMKGQEKDIIAQLAKFPPVYRSPEVELHPTVKVRFRSMFTQQTDDVNKATRLFVQGGARDLESTYFLQKALLVHGLETFNGVDPANSTIQDNFGQMLMEDEEKAVNILAVFRKKRMAWLGMQSTSVIDLLLAAHNAFTNFYDSVVNLRGSPAEVEEKMRKMAEEVGKSTGPLQAGQQRT